MQRKPAPSFIIQAAASLTAQAPRAAGIRGVASHAAASQPRPFTATRSFPSPGATGMPSMAPRFASSIPSRPSGTPAWASYEIPAMGESNQHTLRGFVNGKWVDYSGPSRDVCDPLHSEAALYKMPLLTPEELQPFIDAAGECPRSGLFNLYKNNEKFVEMGNVMSAAARGLYDEQTFDYFVKLIQMTMPKSRTQAVGEIAILRKFLENFSSDRIRMMMRGFTQAGDRTGQISTGLRFPFGATAVVAPFNFPLEIVGMQALGSVMVGNYCLVKASSNTAIVMEAFLEYLLSCGLDPKCMALLPADGKRTEDVLANGEFRCTQFTGSTWVGEHLAAVLKGKVKLEDAGFDMKVLGPDAPAPGTPDWNHAVWQCDQDAYAISGQKCSATSFLCVHDHWLQGAEPKDSRLVKELAAKAANRSIEDLSLGPLLGHSGQDCKDHVDMLMNLPGASLLFGGDIVTEVEASGEANSVRPKPSSKKLSIHPKYGMMTPTAIHVPLSVLRSLPKDHPAFSELFGPLQLVTTFSSEETDGLMKLVDGFSHHLTSGIVSNDNLFLTKVLGATIHGVTYAGNRARTTGAPQNHWFGPAGDPRGAGIGTNEAILHTWTCHREVIMDQGETVGMAHHQS